jgi:hypothetical protein
MSAVIGTPQNGTASVRLSPDLDVSEVECVKIPPGVGRMSRGEEPPEKAAGTCEAPEWWQERYSEAPDAGREELCYDDGGFKHGRSTA